MAKMIILHDSSNSLTQVKVEGELEHQNILPVLRDCYSEGASKNFVWDFTEGNLREITADELRKLARIAKTYGPESEAGKTALVMDKRANFGVGRMFEVYAESEGLDYEIRTFYQLGEAYQWFGLSEGSITFDQENTVSL